MWETTRRWSKQSILFFLATCFMWFSFSTSLQAQSRNEVELYYRGLKLFLFENYPQAEKMFSNLSDSAPSNATFKLLQARSAFQMQDFALADKCFEQAYKLEPQNTDILYYRLYHKITYSYQKKLDQEVCAFIGYPNQFEALLALYKRNNRLDNLQACLESALTNKFRYHIAYYYLSVLSKRKDTAEYVRKYTQFQNDYGFTCDSLPKISHRTEIANSKSATNCAELSNFDPSNADLQQCFSWLQQIFNCQSDPKKAIAKFYEVYPFAPEAALLQACISNDFSPATQALSMLPPNDVFVDFIKFLDKSLKGETNYRPTISLYSKASYGVYIQVLSQTLSSVGRSDVAIKLNSTFKAN